MIKGNKFAAINRAAKRGQPLAQQALKVITEEVESFMERCNSEHVIAPPANVLTDTLSEALVEASPWLASGIDGRKTRNLKAA